MTADFHNSENGSFDTSRALLDFSAPMDYARMMRCLSLFADRYPFLSITSAGTSLYGKSIPMIRLGDESCRDTVLYVGAHHGMEWLTTSLLLRFINEYCEYYKSGRRVFSLNMQYLFRSRLICIIPMLNPDGVDIQQHGAESSPIPDRLKLMNGGSSDFSHWQANGRGVDLNHNYDAGFAQYKVLEKEAGITGGCPTRYSGEYPESEPEVGMLTNYLRFDGSVRMILTLHTQGEEIYYTSGGQYPPKAKNIARLLSQLTGYKASEPIGMASYGGLTDWAIRTLGCPSFTVECGKGENPLPASSFFSVYTAVREMLFTAPILV